MSRIVLSGCSLPPWAAQNQMYAFSRRSHQESLALSILALMAIYRPLFCLASRYARITPDFNIVSKRARTHTHTRVNCATLIVDFSKCSHSVGGVIKIPDRMDKSEATIQMRWCLCHELSYPVARCHLGQHKTKCMHSVGGVIKNPLLCPFLL